MQWSPRQTHQSGCCDPLLTYYPFGQDYSKVDSSTRLQGSSCQWANFVDNSLCVDLERGSTRSYFLIGNPSPQVSGILARARSRVWRVLEICCSLSIISRLFAGKPSISTNLPQSRAKPLLSFLPTVQDSVPALTLKSSRPAYGVLSSL